MRATERGKSTKLIAVVNRAGFTLSRPWASRLVATASIVVMTVGLSVPFASRDLIVQSDPITLHHEVWTAGNAVAAPLASLHPERMALLVQLGLQAVTALITLGGLALIPLLLRSLSARETDMVRWAYAAWLTVLIILALAGLPAWSQFMSQPPSASPSQQVTLEASYILPGVVVFPLGMLLNCGALFLMIREPRPVVAPAPPRTHWQLGASLVLTVGALVWVVGFYLMPEAVTAACPPVVFSVTQFAHGACAGIDSDQVRQATYYAGLNPIALLLYSLSWNYEFLVAIAGITALGGWTRQLSVNTLTWLAIWPVLALGIALVALQGVGVIAQHGLQLTAATGGGWHLGPGMVTTFVGIGLAALGQCGLWYEFARRRAFASAQ